MKLWDPFVSGNKTKNEKSKEKTKKGNIKTTKLNKEERT